jgi:uncharacterized protein (TIGR03032 family)
MSDEAEARNPSNPPAGEREVRYEHSTDLPGVLAGIRASLLVSTYQAGKVAAIGSHDDALTLSFHNFDRPMGIAHRPGSIAVAARNKIWFLQNATGIVAGLRPAGMYDACYLTRSAQVTGEIQAHEMGWGRDELWIVNTLFSCLCTLHTEYSFIPRWQPAFIGSLAPEDRCHLNGMAMDDGRPKYVSAMSETDTPSGWRPTKATSGCLIDVESREIVARGFAMPHSPRVYMGHVWLLDSGRGMLVRVDPNTGRADTVARFPGYTRGLAFYGDLAFVGLSRIRETSTFGGVPIAQERHRLKCGVGIVNIRTGALVGQFEFKAGVEEIFDVSVLPGVCTTEMRGPFASDDGKHAIWTVPKG